MKTKKALALADQLIAALREHADELLDGDGHSIMAPEFYTRLGIPAEFIKPLDRKFASDTRDHKTTIYKDGKIVDCEGVYNLTFLARVCRAMNIETAGSWGRGTQARIYCEAIRKAIGKP